MSDAPPDTDPKPDEATTKKPRRKPGRNRSKPGKRTAPAKMDEEVPPSVGKYSPLIDSPPVFKDNRPNLIEITLIKGEALVQQVLAHLLSVPDYAVNPAAAPALTRALRAQVRLLIAKKLLASADPSDKASLGAVFSAINSQDFDAPTPLFLYADMFGSFQTTTDHFRVLCTPDWIYTLVDSSQAERNLDVPLDNLPMARFSDHDLAFDLAVRNNVHQLIKIRLQATNIYVNSETTPLTPATIALLRPDDRPVAAVLELIRVDPDVVLTIQQRSALHMHRNDAAPLLPQPPLDQARVQSRVKRLSGEMNNTSRAALTLLLPRISTMNAKLLSLQGTAAQLVTDSGEYFARSEGKLPSGPEQALGRIFSPSRAIYRRAGTGVISSPVNVDAERARFVLETTPK
jgi:hypothetical protein